MKHHGVLFVVLTLLTGFTGCGPKTVTVTGKVMFDGEPGQNIRVLYQGKASETGITPEAAVGKTNAQGIYSLSLLNTGKSGALPGEYAVYLSWQDPNPDPSVDIEAADYVPVNKCPYKIPTRARGGLHFTVPPEGSKNADFEFKSEEESFEPPGV